MEISAPSAQRQQIAEIEKQTKEQSQVNIIFFTLLGKGLLASNTDFLISIPFQPDGG